MLQFFTWMLIVFPTPWNDGIIQSQMSKPRSRGEELIQIQRTQRFDIWGTNNIDQKDKVWDGSLYSILRFHIYPEYSKQCSICGQTYRSMEYNKVPRNAQLIFEKDVKSISWRKDNFSTNNTGILRHI